MLQRCLRSQRRTYNSRRFAYFKEAGIEANGEATLDGRSHAHLCDRQNQRI